MSDEFQKIERAIDELAKERHSEGIPAPFRGIGYLIAMLPTGHKIIGLTLFIALLAFAIWRGVSLI